MIEREIYEEFARGDLAFLDAVELLQELGIEPKEAERMVCEWAEALDAEAMNP